MKEFGPEKARLLRAKRRLDPEEQHDDEEFDRQFKKDPFAALSKIEQKQKRSQQNIEKQVSYFGHVIEPFNMRNEEEMGDVDAEGYFVFKKRKGQIRDAWLDSLGAGDEEQLMEGIQKKILQEGKIKPVRTDGEQDAQDEHSQEEEDDGNPKKKVHLNTGAAGQPQREPCEEEPAMTPSEIKYLLSELLPTKMHCAGYLKQLKPQKRQQFKKNVRKSKIVEEESMADATDLEEYEKILELCNLYIEQTGDHEIMTKTKEALSKEITTEAEASLPIQPASDSEPDKLPSNTQQAAKPTSSKEPAARDEDDIF